MSVTPDSIDLVRVPWWRSLYFQVLVAILLGGTLGHFYPDVAVALKP